MGKFQFYHINEHYISYLHSIDTRVQYNKGQRRPYVGIVLSSVQNPHTAKLSVVKSRCIKRYAAILKNWNVKARNMIQITFHLKRKFVQPYLPNNCSFQGAPRRVLLVL